MRGLSISAVFFTLCTLCCYSINLLCFNSGHSLSICTFFNSCTIICGVAAILLGLMYLIAGFRGESPAALPDRDATPKAGQPQPLSDVTETGAAGGESAGTRVMGGLKRGVASVTQAVGKINI